MRFRFTSMTQKRSGRKGIGSKVDIGRLLFTAKRDYLLTNRGKKVRAVDLKDKTIVLFLFPLDPAALWGIDHPDMIDAYNQMLRKGHNVEFVLVPVPPHRPVRFPIPYNFPIPGFESPVYLFNHVLSTIPFPAVPFSDVAACGDRVLNTLCPTCLPYWVVIGPNQQVVTTQYLRKDLFRLFGGDELYPLTPQAISACLRGRLEPREQLVSRWDQLLGDFLLASNGDKVPVSSLKDKVIGLYFCETIRPPRMKVMKRVYLEAKWGGHPFEIVQINFHYHFFGAKNVGTNPTEEPSREDISWLTLPFKDPRCRKLQRIFKCARNDDWDGDCLVIVDPRQDDVVFEFSGAEMFEAYGVRAYPFTRNSLYETEYDRHRKELTLQSLFPQGEPLLCGSQVVDVSRLSRRRVLVLLADHSIYKSCKEYISNLVAKYKSAAEVDFEVVYVSTDVSESSFSRYRGSMPWLVHPYSVHFAAGFARKVFEVFAWSMVAAAAFDECGKLISKDLNLESNADREEKSREFPFMSHSRDLKTIIRGEVNARCDLFKYHP